MSSDPRRGPQPRLARFFVFSSAVTSTFLACGARTGLLVDEETPGRDAGVDHTVPVDAFRADAHDATLEAPVDAGEDVPILFEGGPLDAQPECTTPTYCNPEDPGRIYKCGVPVFQCSSLEQCEEQGDDSSAACVNPCLDTLGQNTSNGCTFYVQEMDTPEQVGGVCYAVYIVNQWSTGQAARIQVTLGGNVLPIEQFARIPVGQGQNILYAPYDANNGLPANQIAVLFLSRDPNAVNNPYNNPPNGTGTPDPTNPAALADCPAGITPAFVGDVALHGTGTASAFKIQTNVPVVAYDMTPYGAGRARVTSASLLLPTNVWGTNYLVNNAYDTTELAFAPAALPEPTLMIFGEQDGTQVSILPTALIEGGGGLAGTAAGTAVTYTVNDGEYLQLTQTEDLSGSIIQSTHPVAVIGGKQEIDVPSTELRADTAHQMLPPIQALGSQYLGVRYRNRSNRAPDNGGEAVPWRIVGAVDGTALTFDPPQAGAPVGVQSGTVQEFTAPGPFVVSSQDSAHPFYFAQYMTGGDVNDAGGADIAGNGEGDPEYVNVIPPAQFLPRYTFFTDPTYPETNLVVTEVLDPTTGVFPTVTLDCAGVLGGWLPVGSSGKFQYTLVDLSSGNFQAQGNCNNGVHTITATLPGGDAGPGPTPFFGVTVWGWGSDATDPGGTDETAPSFTRWVSYGYPAGANLRPLNSVVVPAP